MEINEGITLSEDFCKEILESAMKESEEFEAKWEKEFYDSRFSFKQAVFLGPYSDILPVSTSHYTLLCLYGDFRRKEKEHEEDFEWYGRAYGHYRYFIRQIEAGKLHWEALKSIRSKKSTYHDLAEAFKIVMGEITNRMDAKLKSLGFNLEIYDYLDRFLTRQAVLWRIDENYRKSLL